MSQTILRKWWFWVLAVVFVAFIGLAVMGYVRTGEQERTQKAVEMIRGRAVTLDMVMGRDLPPNPDPMLVDATVEGVDANDNGVRDDVELAIHRNHPDSARIRAAQLQYAIAYQNYFTDVFNKETMEAALEEDSRGYGCIFNTYSVDRGYLEGKDILEYTDEEIKYSNSLIKKHREAIDPLVKEVETSVINTEKRKLFWDNIYSNFMTSFGSSGKDNDCDLDLSQSQ